MKPTSIPELQASVRELSLLQPRGSGSKTALTALQAGAVALDLTGFSGMLEYQPEEYTFTALAGTRLVDVEQALAEHGQFLPFDPPGTARGATLGGTVAAGLSGPGRYRYGGLRDFILGVRFVDGKGQLVRGGGKVVKNAAGFDLPKLMVGSLGQFGALVELSFKVFPRPAAYATVQANFPSLPAALQALIHLTGAPLDLFGLDLIPDRVGTTLLARLGGLPASLTDRLDRLSLLLKNEGAQTTPINGERETEVWHTAREFGWAPTESALVKIALSPARLLALDERLGEGGGQRRYSAGANLAWVAWPAPIGALDSILKDLQLSGLVVFGSGKPVRLGKWVGESFERRVKQALDPAGKFVVLD